MKQNYVKTRGGGATSEACHFLQGESPCLVRSNRKVIVEPVFGQIKNTGFRGFSVRGKDKVAGEFSLVCAVHNIKKVVKAVTKGLVYPKNGKQVENVAI